MTDSNDEIKTRAELLREIEELRRHVSELEASPSRFRAREFAQLLDSLPIGVFVADATGRPIYQNATADRLTGVRLADLPADVREGQQLTATYQSFVAGTNQPYPPERSPLVQALAGRSLGVEDVEIRTNGKTIRLKITAAPIYDKEGRVVRVVALFEDINDRLRMENQLAQLRRQEMMGRLAGSVAHDFNNALTAIIGYASLAHAALFAPDPVRDDIEKVIRIAERAAGRTHRLLAFSHRQIMGLRRMSLNDLLDDMDEMLRSLLGENIQLIINRGPGVRELYADPGQIEQILINLAVNAHDSMPDGGQLVMQTTNLSVDRTFVATHEGAVPGGYVLLRVSDTGRGAGPQTTIRAVEPLNLPTGTGAVTAMESGLGVVAALVRENRGSTWLHSGPEGETVVEICLPWPEEAAHRIPAPQPAAQPTGTETVLFVEDENAVRSPVVRFLRDLGYSVLEGANGAEALSVARAHEGGIDVLVTDVVMPVINGVELARQLAAERPNVKVLLISGYTDDDLRHYGTLDPEPAFLQKPFTGRALARKIREMLEAKPNRRSSVTGQAPP